MRFTRALLRTFAVFYFGSVVLIMISSLLSRLLG